MITLCSAKQACVTNDFIVFEEGRHCEAKKNQTTEEKAIPWGCEISYGGCKNRRCICPNGESCGDPLGGNDGKGDGKICRNNLFKMFLNF